MQKKIFFWISVSLIAGFLFFLNSRKPIEYVNIYNWYGLLPKKLIVQFEKETGIKIRYDVFDNNEMLEAKLFATNSGYDVVFPSASPYVFHQIEAGVYMPLQMEKIPNIQYLNPYIVKEMKKIDPKLEYSIPYIWGTTGLIYNVEMIEKLIKDPKYYESLKLLFNLDHLKKMAPYGVNFLEESIDAFPMTFRALGLDPLDRSEESLHAVSKKLEEMRPYIKGFSTERTSNDLLMGEVIIAQFWSGDAYKTIRSAKNLGKNFRYIIPKEGASLWIDTIAIPKGAPHPNNAHIFINFCLRPDIAAMITNKTFAVTAIDKAKEMIDPYLLKVDFLFPSKEIMETLTIDPPQHGKDGENYSRERLRLWTKIKQDKF